MRRILLLALLGLACLGAGCSVTPDLRGDDSGISLDMDNVRGLVRYTPPEEFFYTGRLGDGPANKDGLPRKTLIEYANGSRSIQILILTSRPEKGLPEFGKKPRQYRIRRPCKGFSLGSGTQTQQLVTAEAGELYKAVQVVGPDFGVVALFTQDYDPAGDKTPWPAAEADLTPEQQKRLDNFEKQADQAISGLVIRNN